MKIEVSSIDWDESGNGQELPTEVTITDPMLIPHLSEDIDGEAANLAEWLTEKYECCINGFVAELILPEMEGNKT